MEEYVIKTLGGIDSDDITSFDSAATSTKYFSCVQKYLNNTSFMQLTELMIRKLE